MAEDPRPPESVLAYLDEHRGIARPRANGEGEREPEFLSWAAFAAKDSPVKSLVKPFLEYGSFGTLTAGANVGKTALLIILSLAVVTGNANILYGLNPRADQIVHRGRIAYVPLENPLGFLRRFKVAAYFHGVTGQDLDGRIMFLDGRVPPKRLIEKLRTLAAYEPIDLVVVETLQELFSGDDPNNNAQVLEYARDLRALTNIPGSPTVIAAAHPVKSYSNEVESLKPYGGGAMFNNVDFNLTLRQMPGEFIELSQNKVRSDAFEPILFKLENHTSPDVIDADLGVPKAMPVMRPSSAEEKDRREEEHANKAMGVLKALIAEPGVTERALAVTLNTNRSKVHRLLENLAKEKLVAKQLKQWTVTAKGQKAINAEAANALL